MSATALHLDLPELTPEAEALRREVRAFVAEERASGHLPPPTRIGLGYSVETTKRIAARGWIGLTWPKEYGGGERSALERYVMNEELLAAALPVGAHWVADRQSGPVLLKFGSEAQKRFYLPRIAAGECFFPTRCNCADNQIMLNIAAGPSRANRAPTLLRHLQEIARIASNLPREFNVTASQSFIELGSQH
jgi:alkylation response protein AidB-like acyl-CoA dehydrogenase